MLRKLVVDKPWIRYEMILCKYRMQCSLTVFFLRSTNFHNKHYVSKNEDSDEATKTTITLIGFQQLSNFYSSFRLIQFDLPFSLYQKHFLLTIAFIIQAINLSSNSSLTFSLFCKSRLIKRLDLFLNSSVRRCCSF